MDSNEELDDDILWGDPDENGVRTGQSSHTISLPQVILFADLTEATQTEPGNMSESPTPH